MTNDTTAAPAAAADLDAAVRFAAEADDIGQYAYHWITDLAAELADTRTERDAAQALADHNLHQFERAMMDWQDARDECRRLSAENAALRARLDAVTAALPLVDTLELAATAAARDGDRELEGVLLMDAARIRALGAGREDAAAEAGTGGGDSAWGREAPAAEGEYWAVVDRWSEPALQRVDLKVARAGDTWWASDPFDDTYGYSPRQILLWGPVAITTPPDGWREALAALDTPQEADHAAR